MKKTNRGNKPDEPKLVGLFAFQGDYSAHGRVIERLGQRFIEVKTPSDLENCTHLIIPGGESTTYLKLLEFRDLEESVRKHVALSRPVFATCAGVILLASEVRNPPQESFGLLNIVVERNSYGRQVDSFETDLKIPVLGDSAFYGVFIRAPRIAKTGENVEVLASYDGDPVLIKQGNILGATFHPELTDNTRVHEYFLSLA